MSNLSGVVREGWLKRVKNQKKRYFVLGFNKETGAAQLQYYENPKKFSSETVPKRVISLQHCLGIIRKVDEKFGNILVLYTKEAVFRLKADTDNLLEDWLKDLNKLHQMEYKNLQELKYDIVWNVKVIPRGLGGVKKVTGSYKLCLKENTLFFVNSATQEVVIEEKLYHIRRFGYSEYCVFMEFGRSTTLGAGEVWMEVEDPLIAQKIEDSLSRSVQPKSSRLERKSMTEGTWNLINEQSINNNDSPKSRRQTFIENLMGKKKGKDATSLRQHSNSVSGTPTRSAEEPITINRNGSLTRMSSNGDDDDSEERHYPKIIPPLPSVGRTISQSSGSLGDDVGLKPRKKISLEFDTKSEDARTELNNYTTISRPKRRSERKQDINVVRQNFVEQYQSSSLPRRTSSSSSSDPSWRRSVGSENFGSVKYEDSDRDSPRDSDREDGESAFFQQNSNQYLKMTPRKQIGSDSSADEPEVPESRVYDPGTYIPLKPPSSTPDLYVQMNRTSPNLEKSRNTSARSSGSYYSPEEGGGSHDPDCSAYVNMKPGSARVTSSSSSEDFPATTDTGDERFDHLNRDNYVNIGPQSPTRGIKKSHSQIQRGSDSAYVNVDMNRSKSVVSKSRRFRIVADDTSHLPGYDDECREVPSNYVNVKANGANGSAESDGNYANFVPPNQKQSTENSPGKKTRGLNYASVEFFKDSPLREESSRRSKNRQENYSKIDFEKSNVLADICSIRARQSHHS